MHEKTLLYGALTMTALAAVYGVARGRDPGTAPTTIGPVSPVDVTNPLSASEVPIRLTASDGTGLALRSLRAETAIEDPLALTELHLVFENPQDRVLEGTFRIALPIGASLSRFAMKVGGSWQEGEVVEKQAARRAYEDFLHRKQDPALMEQGAGNEFTARVFPIPAHGRKEIVVSYSQVLEGGAPYVLPLRGLPRLGELAIDVHATGQKGKDADFGLHQRGVTPAEDFVVDGARLPRSPGLRSGDIALARVVPFATSRPAPVRSALILVDTSASRALGLAHEAELVGRVLGKLPKDAAITVACFDQEVVEVYRGPASGFGEDEVAAIVARGALGASDFERAIAWAAAHAKETKAARVVLVGDGVATAGETDALKLKEQVEKLRGAGVTRLDAIALGGIRDDAFLRTVARGVLDEDGVVLSGDIGPDGLARRLGESTSSGVPVEVDGASWSWPKTLDGLQAGDEVLVYAKLPAETPLRVRVGTQEFTPALRAAERPLVERAWARAKIQSLVDAPTEDANATQREIIALSTRHRVLSPFTAMLVLESDSDYSRFGIDRTANLDILTVKNGRVAVTASPRRWTVPPVMPMGRELSKGTAGPAPAANEAPAEQAARAASEPAPPPAASAPGVADTPLEEREAPTGLANIGATSPSVETKNGEADEAKPQAPRVKAAPAPRPHAKKLADRPRPRPHKPARHVPRTVTPQATARAEPRNDRAGTGTGVGLAGGGAGTTLQLGQPSSRASRAEGHLVERRGGHDEAPHVDVREGALVVERGIADSVVRRAVRGARGRLRACYLTELETHPAAHGHVELRVVIAASGAVRAVEPRAAVGSETFRSCVATTFKRIHFPAPGTGEASFTTSFDFVNLDGVGPAPSVQAGTPPALPKATPYEGRFLVVMKDLERGDGKAALAEAKAWHAEQPGDVMSLVALGEACEVTGDVRTAARAYGSILELFSFRADSRRFAGERLEHLHDPAALALAVDTYEKAREQRPDHPASHRLYAFALVKEGEYDEAFEALREGAQRTYPAGRFRGAGRILKEDLGLVAAAWAKAEPARRAEIMTKLREAGGTAETAPSLRFVLTWETDTNDVDFHIYDGAGGHAYYGSPHLPSGGDLYADVTTGYGPECFTIRGPSARRAYPYTLRAHYYSRGPMGYGMGKLEIINHDGKGGLTFEERPFVVMKDRAYVDLGRVNASEDPKQVFRTVSAGK